MELDKENVVQAIIIMDTFNNNFVPISKTKPMALFPIAGVPLLDYVLESLALGGVGEVILFCCQEPSLIKEHILKCTESKAPWSLGMDIQVLSSDTCQTMGDVMREIDAAGLVRGFFILMSVNTVTNINFSQLLEQHKQTCKKDKGSAMTLVYKRVSWGHPLLSSDKTLFLAANANSSKVLIHQKYKVNSTEKTLDLPLESVLSNSEVALHHTLVDANIALCSPSVPPLFSDNFDFQTRDDLIHGIIINEDILASSLYYTLLKDSEYAASITNWRTYQTVCQDILHKWAHPLSIETGSFFQNNYIHMGSHNFRKQGSSLSRSCNLIENVLIGENTQIKDHSVVTKTFIGKNCTIGKNCSIIGSHIMDYVIIEDNCKVTNCFIDNNVTVKENSVLEGGAILASNVVVKANSHMKGNILEAQENKTEGNAPLNSTSESGTEWENESSHSDGDVCVGFEECRVDSESCYSSDTSDASSLADSPVPEDTNIFLQEVIDSLTRGFEEKLKCDYLILEINSSRYAYNIQLHEVNFFVVRALLSLPVLTTAKNVISTIKDIFKFFRPVVANYIKTKSAVMDCLKAVEDSCIKCEWLDGKVGQLVHLMYETDIVDEDSLLEWYTDLVEDESPLAKQPSLVKFFEWLQEASEEESE